MNQRWAILDAENRAAPWLIGDLHGSCDRTDLTRPPDPVLCAPYPPKR
jgi:hypothetical protein